MLFDADQADPADEVEAAELRAMLRDALALMPERHRVVVVGYFLEGRTSAELATLLGVTESRISQLRKEALELLRGGLEGQFDEGRNVRRVLQYQGGAPQYRAKCAEIAESGYAGMTLA